MSKLIKTDFETLNLILKSMYLSNIQQETWSPEKEFFDRINLRRPFDD